MRVAVIMAGGVGERFWPLSRRERPKQLLPLTGDAPMIEEAVARAERLVGRERVYIVAGPALTPRIQSVARNIPSENFLVEPVGKNTAPCLAFAAGVVARRYGEDASMIAMTSDHLVRDVDAFCRNAELAFERAEQESELVVFGVRPTHPDSGFGYIELGDALREDARGVARIALSFREKPDEATAQRYVESGNFLWNSGLFVWKVSSLLAAFDASCPELGEGARRIRDACGTEGFDAALRETFGAWPSISIDYAVMEKASGVSAVVAEFDWDDVGTWNALARIRPLDEYGNLRVGRGVLVDSRDCIVFNRSERNPASAARNAREPIVAALGVENLAIVVTDDATMVCRRDRVQDIKKLLQSLREQDMSEWL